MRKWRRELHSFDPKDEEELDELKVYLEQIASSTPMSIPQENEENEEEEEDMRLWSLVE